MYILIAYYYPKA